MHIDVEGRKLGLDQDPNYLVVAFVGSPVQRCVSTDFLSVLWLDERIINTIIINIFLLCIVILRHIHITGLGVMFNQESNDVFVTITAGPEEWIPSVLLDAGAGIHSNHFFDLGVVVIFDCVEEQLVLLILRHFVFILLTVVFVVRHLV